MGFNRRIQSFNPFTRFLETERFFLVRLQYIYVIAITSPFYTSERPNPTMTIENDPK